MPFVIVSSGKSGENGAEVQKRKKQFPDFPENPVRFVSGCGVMPRKGLLLGQNSRWDLGLSIRERVGLPVPLFLMHIRKPIKKLLTKKAKYAKIYLRRN